MKKKHRFPYNWTLKDANFTKDKGKVFSCFACGGGSYPKDYNFLKLKPEYLIGMSVPPVVMANISEQIYLQWLQYLK